MLWRLTFFLFKLENLQARLRGGEIGPSVSGKKTQTLLERKKSGPYLRVED